NNLKQIGTAAATFHADWGGLPPSRISNKYATWPMQLLPYLEQKNLANRFDMAVRYQDQPEDAQQSCVNIFFCPTRRKPPSLSDPTITNHSPTGSTGDYAGCGGSRAGYNGDLDDGDPVNGGANGTMVTAEATIVQKRVVSWRPRVRYSDITDGTSNTLLIGERHVPRDTMNTKDIGDGSIYDGEHHRTAARVIGTGPNAYNFDLAKGPNDKTSGQARWQRIFGSYHPGVCNFVFCDGSVRSISNSTNSDVLRRLGTKDDGEVVVLP
ncbi:MAG: DUF1559 domain-containing protein, partial [Planctomycetes bacterium]|nr:DUF1559 domain-containing protein [Planctomycetota bacterium]